MPAKNGNTAARGKSTRGSINALLDLEFATARGKAHLHAAANHVDDLAELERLRGLQKTIKEGIRKGMMERMGISDGGDDELAGLVDDTAADATYVYATPNDEYCCPFTLTSTLRADTPDCTGVAHSTSLESMYRAATDTPLPRPKRHASVVVSLK